MFERELPFTGHSDVCIAILDDPVALDHSCFLGANLTQFPTLLPENATSDGSMSLHVSINRVFVLVNEINVLRGKS